MAVNLSPAWTAEEEAVSKQNNNNTLTLMYLKGVCVTQGSLELLSLLNSFPMLGLQKFALMPGWVLILKAISWIFILKK